MIKVLRWSWDMDGDCTIQQAHVLDTNGVVWEYNSQNTRELDVLFTPAESRPSWSGYHVHSFEQALVELQVMGYLD